MIHRSCVDWFDEYGEDGKSNYVFIVDSMDPLRRVYDFLSPSYEQYIGHPLAFIPAPMPDGEPGPKPQDGGKSYAEHFLQDFIIALDQLGISFPSGGESNNGYEMIMNHRTYEDGEYAKLTDLAIRNKDKIRATIEAESGRDLPKDWYPYNPVSSYNGSMDGVLVSGYEWPYVHWEDLQGREGKSDIRKAEGKMPWRVEWAARWIIHGITCEPAGKDHGSAGGSYDTGRPIYKILCGEMAEKNDFEPPKKMVYEWIQLKGMGPMSSSAGVSIGPLETLKIVPPEILRYLIARTRMARHIDFDTGGKLFEIADEYERMRDFVSIEVDEDEMSSRQYGNFLKDRKAIELSNVDPNSSISDNIGAVSFRHLSMLAQIKESDDEIWKSLQQTGHISGEAHEGLKDRLRRMSNWVDGPHFPEEAKIEIRTQFDNSETGKLVVGSSLFLRELSASLKDCEWDDEGIDDCIRLVARTTEMEIRDAYSTLYVVILGKPHGPKVSSLIFHMGRSEVRSLFESVQMD
jgi:lysyl-tRNA synthetase class 1